MKRHARIDRCRSIRDMSLVTVAMAGLLMLPCHARANEWKSPLRAGAWAAEFGTNLGFDYGYSVGTTAVLAVKRHSSERTAFRWSLGFDVREGEGEGSRATSSSGTGVVDQHDESSFLSTTVQWTTYRPATDRVTLYVAAGPTFRYARGTDSDFRTGVDGYDFNEYGTVRRFIGLQVALGFEWFFANRLSLGSSLGGRGGYEWGNEFSTSEYNRFTPPYVSFYRSNVRTQDVRFNTIGSTLTLTAYF